MQTQSRRAILGQIVAGGIASMAGIPTTAAGADPVFGLIEAHRTAAVAHSAALAEQVTFADWNCEAPCHAEMDAFHELIATAPRTLAGLRAWAAYFSEVETWMFEEEGPTLVATFAEALGKVAI